MQEATNWTHKFKEAFRNIEELYHFLEWEIDFRLKNVSKAYPVFIPRSLAKKIKAEGPKGPLAKEFLPDILEVDPDLNEKGKIDPIGDEKFYKAPQLIHRYTNRALFTPTTVCPVHCRYCFRKNELYSNHEIFDEDFAKTLDYLKNHPEISEVIFTGGDPFTLSTQKLEKYLAAFSEINSLKDIRFHTRYPVILPERIDQEFIQTLSQYTDVFRTVSIAIHANHISEFSEESFSAIRNLGQTKFQLLSQTVLLQGVNDNPSSLIELMELFISLKVRPYYLHHPDRVKGGMHFYLPLSSGRKIYHALRDHLPGWAIPHYVIDLPEGKGKVPAFSEKFHDRIGDEIFFQEPDLFI